MLRYSTQFVKHDIVNEIDQILNAESIYTKTVPHKQAVVFLFAADVFRRKGHKVNVWIDPNIHNSSITIIIYPQPRVLEITFKKTDDVHAHIDSILNSESNFLCLRACGTAITQMLEVTNFVLNNGWTSDKINMESLSQTQEERIHINTTLQINLTKPTIPTKPTKH